MATERIVRPSRSIGNFVVGCSPALEHPWVPPSTPRRSQPRLTSTPSRKSKQHHYAALGRVPLGEASNMHRNNLTSRNLKDIGSESSYESLEQILAAEGYVHTRIVTPESVKQLRSLTPGHDDSPLKNQTKLHPNLSRKRSFFQQIVDIFHGNEEEDAPPLPTSDRQKINNDEAVCKDIGFDDLDSEYADSALSSSTLFSNTLQDTARRLASSNPKLTSSASSKSIPPSPRHSLLPKPSMTTLESSNITAQARTIQSSKSTDSLRKHAQKTPSKKRTQSSKHDITLKDCIKPELRKARSVTSLSRAQGQGTSHPLTPPPPLPALLYPATVFSPPPSPSMEDPLDDDFHPTDTELTLTFPSPERPIVQKKASNIKTNGKIREMLSSWNRDSKKEKPHRLNAVKDLLTGVLKDN